MNNAIFVDSTNFAFADARKGGKLGDFGRKKLSDISNFQERSKPENRDPKSKATITSKEYVDKLQKENEELMKILADRNKLIELSAVELQKLRMNLQKVKLQNSQFAQANSKMLAELNLGKDRLKVLQHDVACQNGILKARELESRNARKGVAACQKANHEAGSSHGDDELGKPSQEDQENKPNGNQRKQSRKQSLGCPPVKPTNDNEEANKKRFCSRRQSTRLKSKVTEISGDSFEVDDAKFPVSCLHDDPVGTSCQTLVGSSPIQDNNEGDVADNVELPVVNVSRVERESDKRRRSRRQSARFIKSEATEESFETSQHDHVVYASSLTAPKVSVDEEEDDGDEFKTQEHQRYSVGRPLRRAAEKVQSYKEVPLNVKMRRMQ